MRFRLTFFILLALWCNSARASAPGSEELFLRAGENGLLAQEGFQRCHRYLKAWLAHADPKTGLIPRNLEKSRDIWNAKDSAADNYPFLVLTAWFTDPLLFRGELRQVLDTERRLTSRLGSLPDTYSFSKEAFTTPEPIVEEIIFGASEYIKDGLLPLTEWLGESPWSDRMLEMLDDIWSLASVKTPFGLVVSENPEINGEMLQVLSRVYWMTGEKKYLDWAVRLGDYYLLGKSHPTRDLETLRLRDHGCEVVSGLCELYATVASALPDKKAEYEEPLHEMLRRILEVGRNEHGLFYNSVDPRSGDVLNSGISDSWGYTYNGFYTAYLIDGTEAYRTAAVDALKSICTHYVGFDWEHGSADGYADAIEGALNLYERERVSCVPAWIDSEMQKMWDLQRPDGIIEGWHGDGNFARTTLMYCLWKTQGVHAEPWRADLRLGAVREGDRLHLVVESGAPWEGKLVFDRPRHKEVLHLPLDWPRINQFPEWFTVSPDDAFVIKNLTDDLEVKANGNRLRVGIAVRLQPNQAQRLIIEKR